MQEKLIKEMYIHSGWGSVLVLVLERDHHGPAKGINKCV